MYAFVFFITCWYVFISCDACDDAVFLLVCVLVLDLNVNVNVNVNQYVCYIVASLFVYNVCLFYKIVSLCSDTSYPTFGVRCRSISCLECEFDIMIPV